MAKKQEYQVEGQLGKVMVNVREEDGSEDLLIVSQL
jgi:hypothetical protein